jgi:hypothetical protein
MAYLVGIPILPVQKDAVRSTCQRLLNSYSSLYWQEHPAFLSVVLRIVHVLTLFERVDFLRSAACITNSAPHPKELMRLGTDGYIVDEILEFLQRLHPRSLLCGILPLM